MLKAFKTEIKPTYEQKQQIHRTCGVCRYLYNLFIATNKQRHEQGLPFMNANEFDKWVNNVHSLELPWIKDVSSKARKKAIVNAETAYKRFFKGVSGFPRFKKKRDQDIGFYAPKNNSGDWTAERHRVKIPTLGWVCLKEFGYLPVSAKVTGGTVTQKTDRYYVSVTVVQGKIIPEPPSGSGIGIDLGLKEFAVVSNGESFPNINKTSAIRRTEKRLKRQQRSLSRKYESKKKGGVSAAGTYRNIAKNVLRVQKLQARLARMRDAYRACVVSALAKTKPAYITIEKLNVKGMMKNRHLSKAIADQGLFDFKIKLQNACKKIGAELREVAAFYPSSKLCSCCGNKKERLLLSERIYVCENCGKSIDRDLNAAINLMQATEYAVLT
ncbi:RNA-guided endonuclease InsQ/TnpB family protein [Paenibacillus alkalitolerans]|uniref:RNA-guided endonuclease InsQ/TnpB family protein n=1 Tax=Paenibacillus alkalitolerans TaxID=2799335 RepID=UPI0018F69555|nr:RNA-guided endonuclease TnpB family protein [Paenibacillus alkalitolerans]